MNHVESALIAELVKAYRKDGGKITRCPKRRAVCAYRSDVVRPSFKKRVFNPFSPNAANGF